MSLVLRPAQGLHNRPQRRKAPGLNAQGNTAELYRRNRTTISVPAGTIVPAAGAWSLAIPLPTG